MRSIPLHKRSALLSFLLLGTFVLGATGLPGEPAAQGAVTQADVLTVGPGKVSFQTDTRGHWLGFTPEWSDRSLFTDGGVIVFATGENGELREIASTRSGLEARDGMRHTVYHEGVTGGFRAPSVNADDDSDGRVNEDRIDGLDNDGDGRVDEDFAAVGDRMVVSEYRTPVNAGPSTLGLLGTAGLEFHQEVYAWSLPHIDGAVMINLWIRNTGYETLRNVHVGAYMQKVAPFTYSQHATNHLISGTEPVEARSLILRDRPIEGGSSVALIGFPREGDDATWSSGYARSAADIADVVRSRTAAAEPSEDPNAAYSPFASRPTGETELTGEESVFAFAVTPRIATIEPGQEIVVRFALVAVPRGSDVNDALSVTLRTFAGDGRHRFLPPPVSMTPRVLWGTYYPVTGATPGVAIAFDALGDDPVDADHVSYLSGVEPGLVDHDELRSGFKQLVLRGEAAVRMLGRNDRVVLKGRLASGEFFEANLRPDDGTQERLASGPTEDAEHFWKIPGKLDDVLDDRIELLRNTPNPFRDATTIHYEVPALIEQESGATLRTSGTLDTSVKIYDVRGRLVTTLVEEAVPPGNYTASWAGVDDVGNPMPSGVYFVKLQIGQKFLTKRVTVVR